MRSLCELLLYLLVDLNLTLVSLNLLLHLVILKDQYLSLLRLVLQLCSQLVVLQDSQMRSRLQLLVIHGQKVRLRLLNVEKHLFAQLLGLLDPIKFLLVNLLKSQRLLLSQVVF